MLRLVDESFEPSQSPQSLGEISSHIRASAEHLSAAYDLIADVELDDRMRLQFSVFEAAAKIGLIAAAIAQEIALSSSRKTRGGKLNALDV